MLITASPVVIPVSTANVPTEAVAAETALKTPIPEPPATSDNPNTRNSTDNQEQPKNATASEKDKAQSGSDDKQKGGEESGQQGSQDQQQTQQRQEVERLQRTDREVRAHEAAHANAGGQLAGAPQLSFKTGPDGKRYAVSGEVSIDTSKVSNDPQATIDKMDQVKRAALAPASPSSQDLKVAAIASQVANQARVELNIEQIEKLEASEKYASSESKTSLSSDKSSEASHEYHFTNPVSARRASLALNQKFLNSGALTSEERNYFLSHSV